MSFISACIVHALHKRVCGVGNGRVGMLAPVIAVPHRMPRHPLRRFPACLCIEKGENLRTHDVAGRGGAAQEAGRDNCVVGVWVGRSRNSPCARGHHGPRRVCACRLQARCSFAVARCLCCTAHRSQHTLAFQARLMPVSPPHARTTSSYPENARAPPSGRVKRASAG